MYVCGSVWQGKGRAGIRQVWAGVRKRRGQMRAAGRQGWVAGRWQGKRQFDLPILSGQVRDRDRGKKWNCPIQSPIIQQKWRSIRVYSYSIYSKSKCAQALAAYRQAAVFMLYLYAIAQAYMVICPNQNH